MKKICSKCEIEKPLDDFNRDIRHKDEKTSACRSCNNAAINAHYHRFPENHRKHHLKQRYKLTLEQFNEKLKRQKFVCACCGVSSPGGMGTWHVDHDHDCCPMPETCGQCIRDLLCHRCNRDLAVLENMNRRTELENYLKKWGK